MDLIHTANNLESDLNLFFMFLKLYPYHFLVSFMRILCVSIFSDVYIFVVIL